MFNLRCYPLPLTDQQPVSQKLQQLGGRRTEWSKGSGRWSLPSGEYLRDVNQSIFPLKEVPFGQPSAEEVAPGLDAALCCFVR